MWNTLANRNSAFKRICFAHEELISIYETIIGACKWFLSNHHSVYLPYLSKQLLFICCYICLTGSSKKNMNLWLPVVTAKFWLRNSQSASGRWVLHFWLSHSVTYGTEEMMNHFQRSWCGHTWLCYFKFCFSPLSYIQPVCVRTQHNTMGRN